MGNWTRTKAAGLLVAAAAAVYSDGVVRAMAAEKETSATPGTPTTPTKSKVKATTKPAATTAAAKSAEATTKAAASEESTKTDAKTGESAAPVDPFAEAVPLVTTSATKTAAELLTDANVAVNDAGLVEIHVNEANLGEVLRMLSLQLERNILASKEVRGTVTANLYDVTVKEALDAILRANDCGYREKGNVLYVYTKKELDQIEKDERKQVTETFRVFYTPAANAVNMLKPVLSPEAQVSFTTPALSGIESGGKDVGGNSHATEDTIVITDFPERLDAVRKVLKEVDRRPKQILVEAVILRAALNESNELGIDFTVLGGVDFSNLPGAVGGTIGSNPLSGALLDRRMAAIQAGGNGLKIGVVTNNVSLFVSALEGVTDTSVVANPKVLVLNKQAGEVHVGARLGYRTAVSTETLTADDVKFLEIGTRLAFRPYIGDDGYIRMEIKPSDSSGSVSAQGLPNEFVTEVTSNVIVRDGRTIVIGGMFRESSDVNRSQVPGFGNLPIAGPLFRRQKDSTIREEVIVLLTPHIVKDDDAFAAASEAEMKQIERLRVGVRHGMMPWGRERLAESAYEHAVKELAKPNGDRKKALWHLDCATNLNPKFSEAIAMKAQLRGEEVTDVDNSSIRTFVQRMALEDRRRPATTMPSHSDVDNSVKAPAAGPGADAEKTAAVAPPTTKPTVAAAAKPVATPAPKVVEAPTTRPSSSTARAADLDTRETAPAGFDKPGIAELSLEDLWGEDAPKAGDEE